MSDQVDQRALHPWGTRGGVAAFTLAIILVRWLDDSDGDTLGVHTPVKRRDKGSNALGKIYHVPGVSVLPAVLAVRLRHRVSSGDGLLLQHCKVR